MIDEIAITAATTTATLTGNLTMNLRPRLPGGAQANKITAEFRSFPR